MKKGKYWICSSALLTMLLPVVAAAQLSLEGGLLFGGPGDQFAYDLTAEWGEVHVVGWNGSATEGLYFAATAPLTLVDWSRSVGYYRGPSSISREASVVYMSGWALPPYCGASDGVGGTEGKPTLFRYDDSGNLLGCGSANFFPYRGGEGYNATVITPDGGTVYAVGRGEEIGFGGFRTIIARYATDGSVLWKRRYGTDTAGNHMGGTYTRIGSRGEDAAWLDGYLYIAGRDRDAEYIGGALPQGMLLKVDAAAEPTDSSPTSYASNLYPIWARLAGVGSVFDGLATSDGAVYAVGSTFITGNCDASDLLVEKYDPAGNRLWRSNPAEMGSAVFRDGVMVGGYLYAVGTLDVACDGNDDILVVQLDPADGAILSSLLWGGAQSDQGWNVATDGQDLFVLGETRSFAENGNVLGQSDVVVLQFSVAAPDSDGDGVGDDEDACLGTEAGEVIRPDGCSIAQLCPCAPTGNAHWRNHGAYVSCVAGTSEEFALLGLLTEAEKDAVVSEAAHSGCGKKGK